jgi:YbbR domain-containing protein
VLVAVKGLSEVVSQINASNITASVDLSKIKETGTKTVPVDIILSDGINAEVVGEITIDVVITRNSSSDSSIIP